MLLADNPMLVEVKLYKRLDKDDSVEATKLW